ncbi:MAG TPA: hypothetical protein DCS93_35915 [Microscillaceae bacterium]|nr:hypothetical protein [Microscillaceae bacterium]
MKHFLQMWGGFIPLTMLLVVQAFGQEIHFSNITSTQGLAHNTVNCVIQDRQGFLWIGTENGLNRYDGYEFKVYRNDLNNQNSLSDNYVIALHEDSKGYIWVGTFGGGLNRFDPVAEKFVRYQHRLGDPTSIWSNDVRAIQEDKKGRIWLGLHDTKVFGYFDPKTQQFKQFRSIKNKHSLSAFTTIPEKDDGFWIGSRGGLTYFDIQKQAYTKYFTVNPVKQGSNQVYNIFRDRVNPNILWLCMLESGLVKFDTQTNQVVQRWHTGNSTLKTNAVMSFHQDKTGTYWVGTQKGFYRFNPAKNHFLLYQSDPYNHRKIAGNNIQQIFEDNAGTFWLCSYKKGLSFFNPYLQNFTYYAPIDQGVSQVSSFCEDKKGHLWIGTKGGTVGLTRLNRQDQTVKVFKTDSNNGQSIASSNVNNLLTDVDGSIWIGTSGQGLDRYDPRTNTFENYPFYDKKQRNIPRVGSLYQDPQQPEALWIGTRGFGLFKFNKKRKQVTKIYRIQDPVNGTTISHNTVIAMAKDHQGNLWLATRKGLSRFDRAREIFTNFIHSPHDLASLSNNHVLALHIDAQQVLWVGTHHGLNRLDLKALYKKQKVKFKRYTVNDGLPNSIVHKIIEDDRGLLWLSTSKGLSRFDKTRETFRNFDQRDGLQGNEFSTNSGLLTKDGAILMGGINGFNLFYPEKVKLNTYLPPVVLTDFRVANQSIGVSKKGLLKRPIWATDTIELSPKHNIISFKFAALNYLLPDKNTYAIFLENFDTDWRNIGHQRTVTYTHLPAGTYRFRVKASNNDGLWSPKEAQVLFIIHPAWWQTRGFKASVLGLLVVLVLGGFYNRKYVRKRKKQSIKVDGSKPATVRIAKGAQTDIAPQLKPIDKREKFFRDEEEIEYLKQQLQAIVVKQEMYKEFDISLAKIAQEMDMTSKKLSILLNTELDTSFTDYINNCRVDAFKEKVQQEENQHLKLISIAYDAGFHSKASFNRIFKKHTGLTPSEYKKKIAKVSNL